MTKKERIKRVATILFAANGIKNTKIEDIANTLGIAKGGIYYYYKSKEKLLLEIVEGSILSRKEFIEELEKSNVSFNEKMRALVKRRISLETDRSSLYLFAKILENGDINLAYDEYLKRDVVLSEFLEKNKEFIKKEYRGDLEKIRVLLTSGMNTLLLYLIYTTKVKVVDEKTYMTMIKKFAKIDIEREIDMFYNMYIKSILL